MESSAAIARRESLDPRARERIRWHARRGLLENDILLSRFLEHELASMPEADLKLMDVLLRWEDNDLLDVLMGRTACPDPSLVTLVERIRSY